MIIKEIGIDAGVSDENGILVGYGGIWKTPLINFNIEKQEGIIGINVGYNSDAYSLYVRRDGSLPMTGHLDMAKNNINNVGTTNTENLNVSENFNGKNVNISGELFSEKNSTLNGITTITGKTVISGNYFSVNAVNTVFNNNVFMKKNLTVSGDVFISGSNNIIKGDLTTQHIKNSGNIENIGDFTTLTANIKEKINAENAEIKNKLTTSKLETNNLILKKRVSYNGVCENDNSSNLALSDYGEMFICFKGRWKRQVNDRLGGVFLTKADTKTGKEICSTPNPSTGDCSCGDVSFGSSRIILSEEYKNCPPNTDRITDDEREVLCGKDRVYIYMCTILRNGEYK